MWGRGGMQVSLIIILILCDLMVSYLIKKRYPEIKSQFSMISKIKIKYIFIIITIVTIIAQINNTGTYYFWFWISSIHLIDNLILIRFIKKNEK